MCQNLPKTKWPPFYCIFNMFFLREIEFPTFFSSTAVCCHVVSVSLTHTSKPVGLIQTHTHTLSGSFNSSCHSHVSADLRPSLWERENSSPTFPPHVDVSSPQHFYSLSNLVCHSLSPSLPLSLPVIPSVWPSVTACQCGMYPTSWRWCVVCGGLSQPAPSEKAFL